MDYAKANTVDVFADGMLVHPELGKSGLFPPPGKGMTADGIQGPAFPHH